MDIVTAVQARLKADPLVVASASGGVDKWKLESDVTHTGKVGVTIRSGGSWAKNIHSARFPRIHIRVHGDPTRDANGIAVAEDAETKAMACWKLVDASLHVPFRFMEQWGDVWVLGSNRESDPTVIERPGERTVLLQAVYDLKIA